MICKTIASTNSHLFALLSNFGLQWSRDARLNFVIEMDPWIRNFLLLVISTHNSGVGVRKARQWACPRFMSHVCSLCLGGLTGHTPKALWSVYASAFGLPFSTITRFSWNCEKQTRTFAEIVWSVLLCLDFPTNALPSVKDEIRTQKSRKNLEEKRSKVKV
jgi:hypothetical protein